MTEPGGPVAGERVVSLRHVAIVVSAALGSALIGLSVLHRPLPSPLEGDFSGRVAVLEDLQGITYAIDVACARGELDTVDELISAEYRAEIVRGLREQGRTWNAATLREQQSLVGDLRGLEWLAGYAEGDSAVLVHSLSTRAQRSSGLEEQHGLRATLFRWNGFGFVLDGKQSRRCPRSTALGPAAAEWAAELAAQR